MGGRRAIMRVNRAGVNIYVDVRGSQDAAPVVFLHGVTASGTGWDWLPPAVTADRRIINVDLRGHGRSDRAAGSYVLPEFADDVLAVLRDVAGTPSVLVGHSLGGAVAWDIAQRHPELVGAAFLADPPLIPAARGAAAGGTLFATRAATDAWQRAGLSVAEIAGRLAAAPTGTTLPGTARGLTAADLDLDDAITARAFGLKHVDVHVLDAALDGSLLVALDTSAPVAAPVLILAADPALGSAFSPDHAKLLTALHPSVEVVRVPGAGHGIHQERAGRPVFTRVLAGFLDRHAPRRPAGTRPAAPELSA